MRGQAGPLRLRHRVGEAIARHALWSAGDTVAVAVSGGRDSVTLLDVLCETRSWHGGVLSVVTVDHGTRSAATQDADFVNELAEARGLTCHRHALHLGPEASEAACRTGRMEVFAALDVDRVALGHHLQDQAETHWLRVLQGSGRKGLGGMRWRRGGLVRPMLDVPPEEILAWANARELLWRQDPTNQSSRFLRNRVRHELLPLLRSLQPGAVATAARSAAWLAEEDQWLDKQIPSEVTLVWISRAPLALVGRWLHRDGIRCTLSDASRVRQWSETDGASILKLSNGRLRALDDGTVVST